MSLVKHAEDELKRAGLFDKDSDYEGKLGAAVLDLVKAFAAQGHSGFSANWTLDVFNKVARWQTLTPISSDPSEWYDRSEESGEPMWQNMRDSAAFSRDGGKTWYHLDGPGEVQRRRSFSRATEGDK